MITILFGKSASGKDAVLRCLRDTYGYVPIVSTTSRPMREKETDGVDYHFTTSQDFKSLIESDSLIEYRSYDTLLNGVPDTWYYGVKKFDLNPKERYVVVLDIEGIKGFIDYFGRKNLKIIHIDTDDEIRRKRAQKRGSFDLTEWNRRLADDNEKFSAEVCKSYRDFYVLNNGRASLFEVARACHLATKI